MSHFNIPIFIPHLGCPFQCIFCNQKKITATNDTLSVQEVDRIIKKSLKTLPKDAEVEVAFFGGSFTGIDTKMQQQYLSVIKPYLEQKLISGVRISTRPDFIDAARLELLKDFGVTTIELGVQSLDDQVLLASGRGYKREAVYNAVSLIKDYNFQTGIQLMIGLPEDDFETDLETTKKTVALKPDLVRIYPTLVIEGTYLANLYRKGEYEPLPLSDAIKTCSLMYLHFQRAEIKVIRMGLHPEEELWQGTSLLAGPFHPSFGELVMQEIYKKQTAFLLQQFMDNHANIRQVKLFVNHRDLSKLIGNHKSNINFWQRIFKLDRISIEQSAAFPRDYIGVGTTASLSPDIYSTRSEFITAYLK